MATKEFMCGHFQPFIKVEVTTKNSHVTYKTISGNPVDEREIRACVGNTLKDQYDYMYTGHYSDRKKAIERLHRDKEILLEEIEAIDFAINATKKRNWIKSI